MVILWLVESLFGSPRKRPDWSLPLMVAGIAMTLLILALRWAH
jgi:hypothetical protein